MIQSNLRLDDLKESYLLKKQRILLNIYLTLHYIKFLGEVMIRKSVDKSMEPQLILRIFLTFPDSSLAILINSHCFVKCYMGTI